MFDVILSLCIILALTQGVIFLSYVGFIIVPFWKHKPGGEGDGRTFEWHFVIPCRDEEAVIGQTLAYLNEHFPDAHTWVVDDDSEDRTAAIVEAFAAHHERVHLVRRRRPDARTGKAHALNHCWRILGEHLESRGADMHRTIMCVVDADGLPSVNLLDVCASRRLFGNDDIAAVQVEVRMSNRRERTPFPEKDWFANLMSRTFVRMQDLEFRGPISAIQMSRKVTGTVNVGGNGQLARMSALLDIADDAGPWRGSLLEDFELGLHLLLAGWTNGYTRAAWVEQEALYSVPRYLTQRARWSQGTMQCFRYLPKIWGNRYLSNLGALELTYFLLQPWAQIVGSIAYPIPLLVMVFNLVNYPAFAQDFLTNGGFVLLSLWIIVGVAEFAVWGPLYLRDEPGHKRRTGVTWGLAYFFYVYFVYAVCWKAFTQLVRRQTAWAKTVRNAEAVTDTQLVARTA